MECMCEAQVGLAPACNALHLILAVLIARLPVKASAVLPNPFVVIGHLAVT